MAREDYYSLLGIDKHAPEREIKRAYYNLARDLHPDKAKDPDEARANAERLAVISKAYNTLKDPAKRAEYDASAGGGSAPAAAAAPKSAPPAAAGSTPPASRPAKPAPKPAGPAAGSAAPKVSANDIQSQRVLTAQKAFVKGMEFYKSGDFKQALPFFEAAVTNDPDGEAMYHMRLAQCLNKTKGSFSRAVEAAEKASSMDTYNMEAKLCLAEIYENVGVTSKAAAVYEDVLKWEPDNARAKLRLDIIRDEEKRKNPNMLAKIFPSFFGKK